MRKIILTKGLVALVLCGCAGTPQDGETARGDVRASKAVREAVDNEGAVEATEKATADADSDDVVCRREYTVGSHMAKTVCRTVGEIEAATKQTQDSMNRNIRRSCSGGLSCSGN